MKVIFLDIDGVLQGYGQQNRHKHDLKEVKESVIKYYSKDFETVNKYDIGAAKYDWDIEVVGMFKTICEYSGAKFVISSDWRLRKTVKQLQLIFSLHDLDCYVIDKVGEYPEIDDRGKEIEEYLRHHKEIEQFVIVDDDYIDSFTKMYPDNFVKTSNIMTKEESAKILHILEK